MATTTRIQELANEAYRSLETTERPNGQEFVRQKDGAPEWVGDMIRKAHQDAGILPDDWRYAKIRDLLAAMTEYDELDEDAGFEIIDGNVDIYTSDLTAWLASSNIRVEYITERLEEFGGEVEDGTKLLQQAQYLEVEEIYNALYDFLRNRAEEA